MIINHPATHKEVSYNNELIIHSKMSVTPRLGNLVFRLVFYLKWIKDHPPFKYKAELQIYRGDQDECIKEIIRMIKAGEKGNAHQSFHREQALDLREEEPWAQALLQLLGNVRTGHGLRLTLARPS